MPVIQINDQAHSLSPGTTRLGSGPEVDLEVGGVAGSGVEAIVELGADRRASVRRAREDAVVKVNGLALGAEPTPLLHGDRLEVLGRELRYAEDEQAGATQVVTADAVAAMVAARQGARRATTATGGRLISLVDGKEYEIPEAGVTLGRDASCDVVVPQTEVSRRHARIVPGPDGYSVIDMSSNGVFVNGTRITETQLLSRADVVRVGSEEFRFYAPVAAPPRPAEPVSAIVEVLEPAELAGQRFELRSGPARIGRGAFNEIPLSHPSVSESHAVLVRNATGWTVKDEGSTNGTWLGAERLEEAKPLPGNTELRAGGVRLRFSLVNAGGSTTASPAAAVAPTQSDESIFGLSMEVPPSATLPRTADVPPAPAMPSLPAAGAVAPAAPAPVAAAVAAPAAPKAAEQRPAAARPAEPRPAAPKPASPRPAAPRPVHASSETRLEDAARRGMPIWLWFIVALLIGAGIYFVLQAR